MTMVIATTWLALALLLCAFAWLASSRLAALTLTPAIAAAALALYVPLGQPRFTSPPAGHYTVVGAQIVPDVAIYALLASPNQPAVYYVLPYSVASANDLQAALDGEGTVTARVPGDADELVPGGVEFDGEPPVADTETKQAEQPEFSVGG